jgi:DNA-binding NarL/FixJ family response regulator
MTPDQAIDYALRTARPASIVPSGPSAAGRPDLLTPRERDVAILIARGRTNRQVAETLVVSHRTVEWHVTNLLGKLGLETRAQLAVWAAGQDFEAADRADD